MKKSKATRFCSSTEEEFIEFMHDASVGKDQFKAMQARALKQLGPVMLRWVRDERSRQADPREVAEAASAVTLNLLMAVSLFLARKGHEEIVCDSAVANFLQAYQAFKGEFFNGRGNDRYKIHTGGSSSR